MRWDIWRSHHQALTLEDKSLKRISASWSWICCRFAKMATCTSSFFTSPSPSLQFAFNSAIFVITFKQTASLKMSSCCFPEISVPSALLSRHCWRKFYMRSRDGRYETMERPREQWRGGWGWGSSDPPSYTFLQNQFCNSSKSDKKLLYY